MLFGARIENGDYEEIVAVEANTKDEADAIAKQYFVKAFGRMECDRLNDKWLANASIAKGGVVHYTYNAEPEQ